MGPRIEAADREFGEWLYRELTADVHREATGWAPERVERLVLVVPQALPYDDPEVVAAQGSGRKGQSR